MTNTKHTPAPWVIGEQNCIWGANNDAVCEMLPASGKKKHNARLIYAAPELLKAVYSLLKIASRNEVLDIMNKEEKAAAHHARAVIAKAKGE